MNKKIYILILCGFFAVALGAQSLHLPAVPDIVTTRHSAMGGYYTTDTTDYFTLFSNPAGIPAAGKHAVWLNLDMQLGGPLDKAITLINSKNLQDELMGLVGANGVNARASVLGPITLGSIGKYFGWGLFNKTRVLALVPGISAMSATGAEELLAYFAFGVPIVNTDNHFLSVGASAKGFAIVEGLFSGSPLSMINEFDKILNTIPLYASFGFGFDAGILYRAWDILSVGATWHNFYTPQWVQDYTVGTLDTFSFDNAWKYGESPNRLDVGVGLRIPMGKAEKVITSWKFFFDYKDFVSLFSQDNDPMARNPLLNIQVGTEFVFLNFLSLRAGISDMYFNTGLGIRIGVVKIDFAVFGKELGIEPGSLPQLNMALALGINY